MESDVLGKVRANNQGLKKKGKGRHGEKDDGCVVSHHSLQGQDEERMSNGEATEIGEQDLLDDVPPLPAATLHSALEHVAPAIPSVAASTASGGSSTGTSQDIARLTETVSTLSNQFSQVAEELAYLKQDNLIVQARINAVATDAQAALAQQTAETVKAFQQFQGESNDKFAMLLSTFTSRLDALQLPVAPAAPARAPRISHFSGDGTGRSRSPTSDGQAPASCMGAGTRQRGNTGLFRPMALATHEF